jgi:hypothetical protein
MNVMQQAVLMDRRTRATRLGLATALAVVAHATPVADGGACDARDVVIDFSRASAVDTLDVLFGVTRPLFDWGTVAPVGAVGTSAALRPL